ncbi:TPR Domain containing protein [Brugia malayi]|uniref:Signal recognition particle subunit SRP72 n=1 Tax=Brugia malayi TaxID=6279 RepID=A0A1P6BXN4_BRUMA|nr:TPR Domain containing protein [Brugia malayi]CDP95582.1 Bm3196, isoform e [Brugia malayi]VIO94519.1 TPR Domain containing protein [Brugia malayi]
MVVESGAKQCFIELAKANTSADYDKALKIANKVLRTYPKETLAFKCKLVALIQLSRLDEALILIKKTPPHHMGDSLFEKAYVLYRKQEDGAALETLSKASECDYRCMELKAQLLYRAERFDEALEIFITLLKDYSDDYDEERCANLIATIAQLQGSGHQQQLPSRLDTFEQLYNGACQLIESGGYSQALKFLEKAEKLCNDTLVEEGLSEEEIEEELSVIRVQKAFVLQMLGKRDDALKIYLRVQNLNPSDKSVIAVVTNNIPSCRVQQNLLEARKKLKIALQVESSKLTARQRRILLLNQALVHLYSNQREPCRRTLEEYIKKYGSSTEVTLIEAALHVRSKELQKALVILKGDPSKEAKLTAVQVLLDEGKLEDASSALDEVAPDLLSYPAILQLRVALLLATEQQNVALSLLKSALDSAKSEKARIAMLEEIASLNVQLGDYPSAADCFEKLSELRPNDMQIMCCLIKAYSAFNVARAEELLAKVFPQGSSTDIDVDVLEDSDFILYGERYRQKKETKTEATDSEIIASKRRAHKRKRKIILPKNFDPKVPPDPERWLPKQERTAFRKKLNKKHRDRDIGKGTQGAVSSSPKIELTITTKANNSPHPVGPVMGVEGPRQQRPAGQQQKKKKKKTGNKCSLWCN